MKKYETVLSDRIPFNTRFLDLWVAKLNRFVAMPAEQAGNYVVGIRATAHDQVAWGFGEDYKEARLIAERKLTALIAAKKA